MSHEHITLPKNLIFNSSKINLFCDTFSSLKYNNLTYYNSIDVDA